MNGLKEQLWQILNIGTIFGPTFSLRNHINLTLRNKITSPTWEKIALPHTSPDLAQNLLSDGYGPLYSTQFSIGTSQKSRVPLNAFLNKLINSASQKLSMWPYPKHCHYLEYILFDSHHRKLTRTHVMACILHSYCILACAHNTEFLMEVFEHHDDVAFLKLHRKQKEYK